MVVDRLLNYTPDGKLTVFKSKFGKDLFNISKVIGRKKVAQFFFDSQCI